jgi:transposase-like protein
MHDRDRVKLLFGPYAAPRLRRGQRATCLNHDATVIITSWTDARISWPRCRPLDRPLGRPTILLDETLARAVRHESAAAVRYWWGVSEGLIWRWRKLLGCGGRTGTPGSVRLITAAARLGGEAMAEREWTDEERDQKRRRSTELGLAQFLTPGYHGPCWTPEDLALLGTLPDAEVARRTGRTANAVRQKRGLLGIPNRFDGRRGRTCGLG